MSSSVNQLAEKPQLKKRPPEERFWKRYSPHGELPLSSGGSVLVHLLAALGIVMVVWLANRLADRSRPPEAIAVVVGDEPAGGGGSEGGSDDGLPGAKPAGEEAAVARSEQATPRPPVPTEQLQDVQAKINPLPVPENDPNSDRVIQDSAFAINNLSNVGSRARDAIDQIMARRGKGGSGSGGGKGDGVGSATGPGTGTGTGKMDQRTRRQLRWTMVFNTADGRDYLRQLHGLGAVLAIPTGNGQYLVVRDLLRRPAQPQPEDLAEMDKIYWIDDKPQSVAQLAHAMQLPTVPDHIAAFFPLELEQKLLTLEKQQARGAREEDILESRFEVRRMGGGTYAPVCVHVRLRRP